ncbi:uncharacterized protein [Palaemon carinicauda]|uniref:uncharacterized protein isoform X2 n=1 Tax=Palaemon carinicauda TaxID=392227 RepID=UPI0035B5A0D1
MAHKNNITVRSSKKSVISKVEIVTVPANNVNSITSRHPVAVVVAEKLCPSSSKDSSKTEPKRLYIPGCPIPQICSRETEEYNVAESAGAFNRKDYSTRGRFKSEKNRLNSKDQKKSKAVTFQIDKVESAHRNPGVCEYSPSSSSDVIDSSVASDSQSGTSGDDRPASETHASSVPRFLLVSKGMRDRIQMESYPDTKAHDIKNTNLYCNFCSTSSCKCIRGSSETVNTSESETSRYSQGVRTRDEFSFQREPDLRSKFAYKDRSARHVVETPPSDNSLDDEDQKFTSTREHNINLEDDSVKPVKSGSFHIRQRPHVLETRREYNANDYKSEMSQKPVSYKKFMGKSKRDSYHPCLSRSSRPASAVPSTGKSH